MQVHTSFSYPSQLSLAIPLRLGKNGGCETHMNDVAESLKHDGTDGTAKASQDMIAHWPLANGRVIKPLQLSS